MHPVAAIAGVAQASTVGHTQQRDAMAIRICHKEPRTSPRRNEACHTHLSATCNFTPRGTPGSHCEGILPARLLGDHQQDTLRDAKTHAAVRYGNLAPSLRARARWQVRGIAQNTRRAWAKRVQPWSDGPAQRHVPTEVFKASSAVVK